MQTIYFKESKPKYDSLKELLRHYFELKNPATFFSGNHKYQCDAGRHRSIDDLLLLCNHYFPDTTIEQMMGAMLDWDNELQKEKGIQLIISVCSTIQRVKLNLGMYPVGIYNCRNMLYVDSMRSEARLSKYSMKDLDVILCKIVEDRKIKDVVKVEDNILQEG